MTFVVKLHPQVERFLRKHAHAKRIIAKLSLLKESPFQYLEHYEGQDFYKLRIGVYRALIDVDPKRNIVFVQYIDHRKRVYKRFK